MYFVGIDISKFKHDCAIVDELGDVITPSWSFQNDYEGFSLLRELLGALDGEKKIGLESTGHYGQNLKLFLENNGFSFMEFNPLLINRFVRSKSLRKTKTDCCFSKRMRKVFRKNEKSMLQNCNKKAKRKGRLQRVKKPM